MIFNRNIITQARNQLGLGRIRIRFADYNVTNWPTLVPRHYMNWDEQASINLEKALSRILFDKKTDKDRALLKAASENSTIPRTMNRRLLLDKLLERFKKQSGNLTTKRIYWTDYHLKGWPRGVSLRSDRWKNVQVLILYRYLAGIFFELVKLKEKQTVTYVDPVVIDPSSVKTKRKRKDESDNDGDDKDDNETEETDDSSSSESAISSHIKNSAESSSFAAFIDSGDFRDLNILKEEEDDDDPCFAECFNEMSHSFSNESLELNASDAFDTEIIADELRDYDPDYDEF